MERGRRGARAEVVEAVEADDVAGAQRVVLQDGLNRITRAVRGKPRIRARTNRARRVLIAFIGVVVDVIDVNRRRDLERVQTGAADRRIVYPSTILRPVS